MSRFNLEDSVAHVVATAPRTSRVFERHGVDFCCGGKISLAQACERRGIETQRMLDELELATREAAPEEDMSGVGIPALIERIVTHHHEFVRRETPRLGALMQKVARVHGENHPDTLPAMARIWAAVSKAFEQHMAREEEVLFPWFAALDEGRVTSDMARGLEMPIAVMESEHDEHGAAFAHLRALANGYVVPDDACGSWRALWSGLDEFERDLHRHVHLENHLLFPLARARAGLQPA